MKLYSILAIGVMGLAPYGAIAIDSKDFVSKATIAGEFEIESSKLALEKSQNKDIQGFAQKMIDDHKAASEKLHLALQADKMEAPKEELDNAHQNQMTQLEALSGDDFNHRYIAMQTDAHKEAVTLFTDYAKHGDDAQLKKFASDTLPTLEGHLKHVKSLKEKE